MTGNSRDDSSSCTPLRQRAEERLRLHRGDVSAMSPEQVQTLVHELQVYQIELQMQNEELLDTQQELAESRDRYFDLYELAPVGYVTIGPDYRIDRCNRTAAELLGTERSKLKGAVLAALVAPEDRDTCFLALRQTLETGGRCTCECAIHCPAVDRRHVQIAIAPLVDETPGDGCRVTLTDITARKLTEEKLRQTEERLRSFVTASSDVVYRMSPDWSEMRELIGREFLADTTVPSRNWLKRYIDPHDQEQVLSAINQAIRSKSAFQIEHRVRRPDGSLGWAFSRAVPLFDSAGEIVEWTGAASDITARKLAEEQQRESEFQLRLAVEASGIGYWDWDLQTDRVRFSSEWKQQIGYGDEEISDRFEEWRSRVHPDDVDLALQRAKTYLANPRGRYETEFRLRHKDGNYRTILAMGMVLPGPEGNPRRFVGCHIDITEREQRTRELERTRNLLADAQQIAQLGSWEYIAATQETVWSDEQKRIFGLDSHEPSPDYGDLFRDHIHPEDAAEWDRRFREAMKNSRTYEHEFRIIRSDGGVRYVRSKAQPSHDETGKLVRYVGVTLDITERREAEQELLRSKERLELAKRAAGQGVWDWNIPTGEFNWSPEIFTLFGLDVDADSPSFATWEAAMHPEDRAAARECVERALRDRTLFNTEYRVEHPDGKVRWIGGIGRASYDDAGHAVRMIGINMDVTERREILEKMRQWNAELEKTVAIRTAELRDANARLQATLNALPDLMFSLDREGRFELYHAKDAAQLYVADSEFMGRKVTEVLPESASRIVMAALEDAAVNGLHRGAVYSLSLPQGPCWFELSVAPTKMPMDADGHFIVLVRDISERKRLEDQLRSNEEKYRSLVENISECIWELDTQGRFTYLSPRFQELTGYSPEEFLGKPPAGLIPEDEAPRIREWEQSVGEEETKIPPMEFRATRKDGQSYHVEVKGTLRRSSTGQALGMRGIMQDVTERIRAEEILRRFNEDLERQVQHRTAAIRMLRDVAAMANETQDPLQAADYCLKQLATQLGWLCGHVWWIDAEDGRFLLPRCVWYPLDTVRWDEFRTVTLQTRLRCNAGLPGRAIAGGRPHWTIQLQRALSAPRAAVARKLGLATAVAVPVVARGKPVAVLEFFSDCQLPRDPGMIDILTGVALQLGRVIERREFEEHLLASTEDVRRGIAQDLHDDVGQELTGVSLLAAALSKLNPPATQATIKLSADIAVALSRTHEKLRSLCHSAMPRELQEGNLIAAIMQLAAFTRDNSHIACEFACELPEEAFDSRSSTQLYRIVQEAISNAVRHARARNIRIELRQGRGDLLLTIEDDGKGMPDGLPMNHGMGLQTMRYRAGMLGGTLEVGLGQGRGMRVVCRVPAAIRSPSTPTASKRSSRCRRKS